MERRLTERRYDAVVFDLLTALIDSWTLWNFAAGSPEAGLRWRRGRRCLRGHRHRRRGGLLQAAA